MRIITYLILTIVNLQTICINTYFLNNLIHPHVYEIIESSDFNSPEYIEIFRFNESDFIRFFLSSLIFMYLLSNKYIIKNIDIFIFLILIFYITGFNPLLYILSLIHCDSIEILNIDTSVIDIIDMDSEEYYVWFYYDDIEYLNYMLEKECFKMISSSSYSNKNSFDSSFLNFIESDDSEDLIDL